MPNQRDIAMDLMDEKRFSEAIPIFNNLIEITPDDWSTHYMLGQCLRFTAKIVGAVQSLQKATSLNSANPQVFLAYGIALQIEGRYEEAISALEHAIELDAGFISAYNSLGMTYRIIGNSRTAIDWYSLATDKLVEMAQDVAKEDKDKCFEDKIIDGVKSRVFLPYYMEKIYSTLRSDPTYSIIMNNIGVCLIELGDTELARERFLESIEFIPDGYKYPEPSQNIQSLN